MKRKLLSLADILIILGVLFLAIIIFFSFFLSNKGNRVVVTIENETVAELDLNVDSKRTFSTEYGFNNLVIYDGDQLASENFMRWYYSGILNKGPKASRLNFFLEMMHPEVHVEAHDENIDDSKILEEMGSADYIVFTVGSSDIQLKLNQVLREYGCKAKVLFVWLEAGGKYSHVLKIDYRAPGCYQCLFTDDTGNLVNNQANITAEELVEYNTIHNGCGATRAAYGTSVLLRTTSVLLDILEKEENMADYGNYLVNISPTSVLYDSGAFVKEACHCCGN